MDDTIRRLKELTDASDNIVFFGGAGVSTESGIPDFRSVDGLYHQKLRLPAGDHAQPHYFTRRTPRNSTDFYRDKMLCPGRPAQRRPPQAGGAGSGRGS